MRIKTSKFDKDFDEGRDISRSLDMAKARRPGLVQRRVNVDIPEWMIQSLDREATRLGVPRQSLVKMWLAERLERLRAS